MTDNFERSQSSSASQKDDVVMSVKGVSKKFCRSLKRSLWYGIQDLAGELLGNDQEHDALRKDEFWALKDISFELRRGEALGLVGANGAGKTTLLRIISGLIKPDQGEIEIKGRIAPLIALGAGFSPILTGRENIYANMSILGLTKQEIDDRFGDVVEFAEIGEALDAPVQSYSSGMGARLGFACAIHVEPEILLIDEVLSVGDIKFRGKCFRKLAELKRNKTSFILVSHSPQSILNNCQFALYLYKGKLLSFDQTELVVEKYEADTFGIHANKYISRAVFPVDEIAKELGLCITSIYFRENEGNVVDVLESGSRVDFCVECQVYRVINPLFIHLIVKEVGRGDEIVITLSNLNTDTYTEVYPGTHIIIFRMPYLGFKPGIYTMQVLVREGTLFTLHEIPSFRFVIQGGIKNNLFYQPHKWLIESK